MNKNEDKGKNEKTKSKNNKQSKNSEGVIKAGREKITTTTTINIDKNEKSNNKKGARRDEVTIEETRC